MWSLTDESNQGINIGTLCQFGTGSRPGPLSLDDGEDEYRLVLSRLTGEQYELLPLTANLEGVTPQQLSALFSHHVLIWGELRRGRARAESHYIVARLLDPRDVRLQF